MDPQRRIRVLLVDDHGMIRLGIRAMLAQSPKFEVVGEADSVESAFKHILGLQPDIILLDVRLGDESGLTVCRKVQALECRPRVLVLTGFSEESLLNQAALVGADGYVLKGVDGAALCEAIESVMAGRPVISPELRPLMARTGSESPSYPTERLDALSGQERKILGGVVEGKTNREIAAELGLSEKTVRNYLSNALSKLGVKRRSQAAAVFAKYQFV